jgi:Glycosyltransferase WbsX/Methyltransferase domain
MNDVIFLKHPICLSTPERLAMSAWTGHVPFAMYLIDVLRPRALVELGTHYGVSFCAFCQAVRELKLNTRCYATDSWKGDKHAGFYGPEVLEDLKQHHDPRYGAFSQLIQSSFHEAVKLFDNGTLDLLHIDGLHTYEEVRRDFETWLPKMSERGIILFHDTHEREADFGVWKLWAELVVKYPSFEFLHSHGLGVLAVGQSFPDELNHFFKAGEKEVADIRSFFSTLGSRVEALNESQTQRVELESLRSQLAESAQTISALTTQAQHADKRCAELLSECERQKNQIEEQSELHRELKELKQQLEAARRELQSRDLTVKQLNWQIGEWKLREAEFEKLQAAYNEAAAISRTGSYKLVRSLSAPLRIMKRRVVPALRNGKTRFAQKSATHFTSAEGLDRSLMETDHGAAFAVEQSEITPISKLFDPEWYLNEYEDVARLGMDPFLHFLRSGIREGRAPHPLFDPKYYLKTYPETAMSGKTPLQHYLASGWKQGLRPNPKFDPAFYVSMYPDIAEAGIEPLTHFISIGLREGRSGLPEDMQFDPLNVELEIPREPLPPDESFETDVKAIAFYLPQFHPIPENNLWWGEGFTEWTNVRQGTPQFTGHYQPHVPSDLSYYDLRESTTLAKQIELARNSGVYGFCFYYYWFAGHILLDLPLRRMLESPGLDFPFSVCWANENWTRRWDGREHEVLIAQKHSAADDLAFINNMEQFLVHPNYIRIDGKPLLVVYQPALLPDARATAERWRKRYRELGHGELYLAAMRTFADRAPAEQYGFDARIQFPPHISSPPINPIVPGLEKSFGGSIYDYTRTKWSFINELREPDEALDVYPGVMPSWDNTARRRSQSSVWLNSSPESYFDWLQQVTSLLRQTRPPEERLVFINAWNEWAEGCHLEPDELFGHAWLNATRLALKSDVSAT